MTEYTAPQSQFGRLTLADISQTVAFFLPREADGFGGMRPPFSPQLARMSAELASNVYDLNLAPWVKAGFTDCTFVVEDRVVALDQDSHSTLATIENEWKRRRAKSLIQGVRPIGDLMRALRQILRTDMGKSVVMTRILPDGRVVVAISFIGTTQKFFDWFSNFKLKRETGIHYGFLELARHFDAQASRVSLPALAQALGKETFTLADALAETRGTDGRFKLWLSGHSQGGALVQTYTHLLLGRGIPAENIIGYSFASPTVSVCGSAENPAGYPLYHIVNADDITTRVGAHIRLGMDCVYFPDDAFRKAHYRIETALQPAFDRMSFLAAQVQTTQDTFAWGIALMGLLGAAPEDETVEALFMELIPHMSIMRRMGLDTNEIAQFLRGKLTEYHEALTGVLPDEAQCNRYAEAFRSATVEFGAKHTAQSLLCSLLVPHGIRPDKRDEAFVPPYIAITRKYLGELAFGTWCPDAPPRCLSAKGEHLLPQKKNALHDEKETESAP